MSVAAAVEQLAPGSIVPGARLRRVLDTTPKALVARAGVRWATGDDELGAARYAVLRRRGSGAPPVVLVAYDGSEGIDLLGADDMSDGEIDALLNELRVGLAEHPADDSKARRRSG